MAIRVLVVDDSALVRQMLTEFLDADPEIEVVGSAADPLIARQKIKALSPDVLTLDIEMPKMDGISFLRQLMRLRPMPVVMVSTLTEAGADVTLEALELGAVDFVEKPRSNLSGTFRNYQEEICEKVKAAARARLHVLEQRSRGGGSEERAKRPPAVFRTTDALVAIGASTGGTEAILDVLSAMSADAPGTVVTQHIPAAFSAPFARRLDANSRMQVSQARDGDIIIAGHAFVAPGDAHLRVERSGAKFVCRLDHGEPVNRHRPSVDVMFRSIAREVGRNAVAALLTGMGKDGALGMLEMREAGAATVAQDEATSVVWGMPGAAVALDAADVVCPLDEVASEIAKALRKR